MASCRATATAAESEADDGCRLADRKAEVGDGLQPVGRMVEDVATHNARRRDLGMRTSDVRCGADHDRKDPSDDSPLSALAIWLDDLVSIYSGPLDS